MTSGNTAFLVGNIDGLILPAMNGTGITGISGPIAGQTVYNSSLGVHAVYNGTQWNNWGSVLISKFTVGVATGTIGFNNIPQTFNHLKVMCYTRTSTSGNSDGVLMQYNGDTGSNYTWMLIYNNSNVTYGGQVSTATYVGVTISSSATANIFAAIENTIPCYTNTAAFKVNYGSGSSVFSAVGSLSVAGGYWANTNAITSITLIPQTGANTFNVGCQFFLYGIY